MQTKVVGKVFGSFLSATSNSQASLQTRNIKTMKDLQYFSRIIARAKYYQERVVEQKGHKIRF